MGGKMKRKKYVVLAVISVVLSINLALWVGCDAPTGGGCGSSSSSSSSGGNVDQADNPIIKDIRTADASPLVYDGKFYIVCGQDRLVGEGFQMPAWYLLSSADMVHWEKKVILRPSEVPWMDRRGSTNEAWASCIVHRNGYFYFYTSNAWAIGVFKSSKIEGPYEDMLGRPLINENTPNNTPNPDARDIDPMCFIDDDGKAYLFWGGDGICRYARLTDDMAHLATGVMDVPGLTGSGYTYLEAPFIIKENGTYFLMYADDPWPSEIRYATSSSVHGPWTHRGVIGTRTGRGTNHEGAAYFNGQWWYTYHSEELSRGNPYSRSVCVDRMYINGNTIQKINYTSLTLY